MAFEVPALSFSHDALEPYINKRTMELHHGLHHAAYVNKFNGAIEGTDLASKSAEEIIQDLDAVPENIRTAVRNNGGGHVNHSIFWSIMGPGKGGEPTCLAPVSDDSQCRAPRHVGEAERAAGGEEP